MEAAGVAPLARIGWACPACGSGLDLAAGRGSCARHGEVATTNADGVVEFDSSDAYWGEVDREAMRAVNRAARRSSWRAALDSELRAIRPDLVEYVHHPSRADWQVLLPFDRERTTVLDVGAGWGANSFGVAPNVATVVAVEKIAERVEWIAIRRSQDGIHNLIPVRAELQRLPFAPESF